MQLSNSMLGTSSYGSGLVSHPTQWSTLWVYHPYSSDFSQSYSQSYYKLITAILASIPMSANSSSTGKPMAITTATDLYIYHTPWMLPVIPSFKGPPINLTGEIFSTGIGLSASMLSFVNSTTESWYNPSFTIYACVAKETSVDAFSTSIFLHDYVALFYRDSMSHYHIILSGRCHITNWHCNISSFHLCTTWGTLSSDSKKNLVHCNMTVLWILIPTSTF